MMGAAISIMTGMFYGSFIVIALIHKVLAKRLEQMGRGRGLKRVLRMEIWSITGITVIFTAFYVLWAGNKLGMQSELQFLWLLFIPLFAFLPFLMLIVFYAFVVFSYRCVKTFYRAWRETELEASEGG